MLPQDILIGGLGAALPVLLLLGAEFIFGKVKAWKKSI